MAVKVDVGRLLQILSTAKSTSPSMNWSMKTGIGVERTTTVATVALSTTVARRTIELALTLAVPTTIIMVHRRLADSTTLRVAATSRNLRAVLVVDMGAVNRTLRTIVTRVIISTVVLRDEADMATTKAEMSENLTATTTKEVGVAAGHPTVTTSTMATEMAMATSQEGMVGTHLLQIGPLQETAKANHTSPDRPHTNQKALQASCMTSVN